MYKKVLSGGRYNNNVIKKIIRNEVLSGLFRFFLEKHAKNWIS
jgi:hypothetical protein